MTAEARSFLPRVVQGTDGDVSLIVGEVFRRPAFGDNHPLAIGRMAAVYDLCAALGWLMPERTVEAPMADTAALARFHDPDYVAAVRRIGAEGRVQEEDRERFGIGGRENPAFAGLFERAATSCGASIAAATQALAGGVAFNPAGGTHHARAGRASGFCYFNDPVMAILTLLDGGLERVFYLDLDAHHGDGVELAVADDPRVFTVSIHERDRWPGTGALTDRAGGRARNLPVPRGFTDGELACLMDGAVLPLIRRFDPQALVVTCGADGLAGDPLSAMALSNGALWQAVESALGLVPRAVVLGGGGYNPWTVARCWAGLWGRLAGLPFPDRLPDAARNVLERLDCDLVDEEDRDPAWYGTLFDAPGDMTVRPEIVEMARTVVG